MASYRQGAILLMSVLTWSGCDGEPLETGEDLAPDGGTDAGNDASVPRTIDGVPPLSLDVALPLVFVHGFAGSAQQYQSQAMRFEANGFPVGRIRAFEHHGGQVPDDFPAALDVFVDGVLAEFGVPKVYLVGHSRGTLVSSDYLGDPTRAAKVAKYVALDGLPCIDATTTGVPCVTINQALLTGQSHVECATSLESFVKQYEFLLGKTPEITQIVPQTEPVVISGRAVNFPENTGRDGANLDVWELDFATGARSGAAPVASYSIGADGNWGPLTVDPTKHYEMVLSGDASTLHHHYMQPFIRSTPFVRLLSGEPGTATRVNTHTGPNHAAVIAMRMREWQTSDALEVSTSTPDGMNQPPVNVITMGVGVDPGGMGGLGALVPRGRIGIHLHDDAATPGMSSLGELPWFSSQPFQTGVDLFMPASTAANGTVTVTSIPRGDTARPQILRLPNWPSDVHLSTLMFSDYAQD